MPCEASSNDGGRVGPRQLPLNSNTQYGARVRERCTNPALDSAARRALGPLGTRRGLGISPLPRRHDRAHGTSGKALERRISMILVYLGGDGSCPKGGVVVF